MKIITTVFLLLFYQNLLFSQLSLEIEIDKKEYLIHEPIILLVKIKNNSNKPEKFIFDLFTNRGILNMEHNGITFECTNSGHDALKPILLEPKSYYYYTYHLISFMGCTNSNYENSPFLEHLTEGVYKLFLEYYFSSSGFNNNSKNVVCSNTLEFNINKPKSSKHITQLNKYKELMINQGFKNKIFESNLNDIIKVDPKSPYSILSSYRAISIIKSSGNSNKYEKLMKEFCVNYPGSFISYYYIKSYPKVLDFVLLNANLRNSPIHEMGYKFLIMKENMEYVN